MQGIFRTIAQANFISANIWVLIFLDVKAMHAGIVAIFMQKVKDRKRTRMHPSRFRCSIMQRNIMGHAFLCACIHQRSRASIETKKQWKFIKTYVDHPFCILPLVTDS